MLAKNKVETSIKLLRKIDREKRCGVEGRYVVGRLTIINTLISGWLHWRVRQKLVCANYHDALRNNRADVRVVHFAREVRATAAFLVMLAA